MLSVVDGICSEPMVRRWPILDLKAAKNRYRYDSIVSRQSPAPRRLRRGRLARRWRAGRIVFPTSQSAQVRTQTWKPVCSSLERKIGYDPLKLTRLIERKSLDPNARIF